MTAGTALGVAVIGRGFGERVVAPAFAATDGVDVVSVVSARDEEAVAEAIADPRVGLVSVHSPPFLHDRHVRMALGAQRSVLCDKPFTADIETSRQLVVDARGVPGVQLLNLEFRCDPARLRMREIVQSGALGTVEHVAWTHFSAGSRHPLRPYGWLFDRERGGGWIGAWASHAIDTLRFVVGEVDRVVSTTPRIAIRYRPDADGVEHECTAEDGLTAVLALAGGASVAIDSSFAATASLPPRLVIVGSEATLENVADRRLTLLRSDEREDVPLPSVEGATADHHVGPMHAYAAAVSESVRTGEVPRNVASFADGLACDEILTRLRGVTS